MDEMFIRTIGLIGESNFANIQNKTILVVGLGGVGGTALEALARSGFAHFVIIDSDTINPSNLNRQILYTCKDIGLSKAKCAKERLLSVIPTVDVKEIEMHLDESNISKLDGFKFDFIVDAIDDTYAKVLLAKYSFEKDIPLIMSLGMANRIDPSKVEIIRLDKTTNDPLAKKMRHELKVNNVDTSKIMTVCSKELPLKDNEKLHSMMMAPSSAGLNIAKYILSYFIL